MIQSLDSEISRHEGQVTLIFTHFSKERCKFEQKCSMSKPHVITESLPTKSVPPTESPWWGVKPYPPTKNSVGKTLKLS